MPFLRSIDYSIWMPIIGHHNRVLEADVVSDFKTTNNEVSVWSVQADLSDKDDVAIAMALARDGVRDLWLVPLDPQIMETCPYWKTTPEFQSQPGDTAYMSMVNNHYNLKIRTLWEMGYLAEHIHNLLDTDFVKNCFHYDSNQLLTMMQTAIDAGKLTDDEIKNSNKGKWLKALKARRAVTLSTSSTVTSKP